MFYKQKMIIVAVVMLCLGLIRPAFAQTVEPVFLYADNSLHFEMEAVDRDQAQVREDRFSHMSSEEKERIRKRYERFKSLPLEKQELLKKRWRAFKKLSPEEQERIKRRQERFKKMTPEQRERLLRRRERWQKLSPEEREALRKKREMRRQETLHRERRSDERQVRPLDGRMRQDERKSTK